MFEGKVAGILRQYLGDYVEGLDKDALSIGIFKGDVQLQNQKLKPGAFAALGLPIKVVGGFVGKITVKIPWRNLGNKPITILIENIFAIINPKDKTDQPTNINKERELLAKRRKIHTAESLWLEKKDSSGAEGEDEANKEEKEGWFRAFLNTIIGNIQLTIANVHARYEDATSSPGHPFATGITLGSIKVITVDEEGKETFVKSGALRLIRKKVILERLAIYHDSDCSLWSIGEEKIDSWVNLSDEEWRAMFLAGLNKPASESRHSFLIRPINGSFGFTQLGVHERQKRSNSEPVQDVNMVIDDITVALTGDQIRDILRLLEWMSSGSVFSPYAHLQPQEGVKQNPRAWWQFAYTVLKKEINLRRSRLRWKDIADISRLRKKYVELYSKLILEEKSGPDTEDSEIITMDDALSWEIALLFRKLAHQKVIAEKEKAKAAPKGIMGWFFRGKKEDKDAEDTAAGSGAMTSNELEELNKLMEYDPQLEEKLDELDAENEAAILKRARIRLNKVSLCLSRCKDGENRDVADVNLEGSELLLNIYPKSLQTYTSIVLVNICSPEGSMIEAGRTSLDVAPKEQAKAIALEFSSNQSPPKPDIYLKVQAMPLFVTVYGKSLKRIMSFIDLCSSTATVEKTSKAASMTVASLIEATQNQVTTTYKKERTLDITVDLDAPKIAVPLSILRAVESTKTDDSHEKFEADSTLFLNLGKFVMGSTKSSLKPHRYYNSFYLNGTGISAYVIQGPFSWSTLQAQAGNKESVTILEPARSLIFLCIEQVNYSSTRITRCSELSCLAAYCNSLNTTIDIATRYGLKKKTVQGKMRIGIDLSQIKMIFSPSRYHFLMAVVNNLAKAASSSSSEKEVEKQPWIKRHSSYVVAHGKAYVLKWTGVARSVAKWKSCVLAVKDGYLYVLKDEEDKTYEAYYSLADKMISSVPAESIGGFDQVLTICQLGADVSKGVDMGPCFMARFDDEETLRRWELDLRRESARVSKPSIPSDDEYQTDTESESESDPIPAVIEAWDLQCVLVIQKVDLMIMGSASSDYGGRSANSLIDFSQEQNFLELSARTAKTALNVSTEEVGVSCCLQSVQIVDYIAMQSNVIAPDDTLLTMLSTENFNEAAAVATRINVHDTLDFDKIHSFVTRSLDKTRTSREIQDFAQVYFHYIKPDTKSYRDIDTTLDTKLRSVSVHIRAETLNTLISYPSQLAQPSQKTSNTALASKGNQASLSIQGDLDENADDGEIVIVKKGKKRILSKIKAEMHSAKLVLVRPGCMGSPIRGSHSPSKENALVLLQLQTLIYEMSVFSNSTYSMQARLGDLQVLDGCLDASHPYRVIIGMKNKEDANLVDVKIENFSDSDDDYKGYAYAITGHLSEIKVVVLYSFLGDMLQYRIGGQKEQRAINDAISNSAQALKSAGQSAAASTMKLDIELKAPVLIMPRCTHSADAAYFALGQINLKSSPNLLKSGAAEEEILIDKMHVELTEIQAYMIIQQNRGQSLIRQNTGLEIDINRALYDPTKTIPAIEAKIRINSMKMELSAPEFDVFMGILGDNFGEAEALQDQKPSTDVYVAENESLKEQYSKQEPSQMTLSSGQKSLSLSLSVEIGQLQLDLFSGNPDSNGARLDPLASLELGMSLFLEQFSNRSIKVIFGLPFLTVADTRSHIVGHGSNRTERVILGSRQDDDGVVNSSLLYLDFASVAEENSSNLFLQIQRPDIVLDLEFILDLVGFASPVLKGPSSSGLERNKPAGPNHPGLPFSTDILLPTGHGGQPTQIPESVTLNPQCRIIADQSMGEIVYDGKDGVLLLPPSTDGIRGALILIGRNVVLRFKNVTIYNSQNLSALSSLNVNSKILTRKEDSVLLLNHSPPHDSEHSSGKSLIWELLSSKHSSVTPTASGQGSSPAMEITVTVSIFSPRLILKETLEDFEDRLALRSAGAAAKPEALSQPRDPKMLEIQTDLHLKFFSKGKERLGIQAYLYSLKVNLRGGNIDQLPILRPSDLEFSYEFGSIDQRSHSTIFFKLIKIESTLTMTSIDLIQKQIQVMLRVMEAAGLLAPPKTTQEVREFKKIGQVSIRSDDMIEKLTIWEPVSTSDKYVHLGHIAVSGKNAPDFPVRMFRSDLMMSDQRPAIAKTENLEPVYSVGKIIIYKACPPAGYVALGYTVHDEESGDFSGCAYCIAKELVTPSELGTCLLVDDNIQVWENSSVTGTFLLGSSREECIKEAFELRDVAKLSGSGDFNFTSPVGLANEEKPDATFHKEAIVDLADNDQGLLSKMASVMQKVGPIGTKADNTELFDDWDHLMKVISLHSGKFNDIRMSEVKVWYSDFIRGIQVSYAVKTRTELAKRHLRDKAYKDIKMGSMSLQPGEFICKVSGHRSDKFTTLILETNKGNIKEFGQKNKKAVPNFTLEVPRGRRAVAFFGGHAGNLHNIGLYHMPVLEHTPSMKRIQTMHALSSNSRHDEIVQTFLPVYSFNLVWGPWERKPKDSLSLSVNLLQSRSENLPEFSIWVPKLPAGYYSFGHIALKGVEPPESTLIVRDDPSETLLKRPVQFRPLWSYDSEDPGIQKLSIWEMVPPDGFISLGAVATIRNRLPDIDSFRCVREDLTAPVQNLKEIWCVEDAKKYNIEDKRGGRGPIGLWEVRNSFNTFFTSPNLSRCRCLSSLNPYLNFLKSSGKEEQANLSSRVEIKGIEVFLVDDVKEVPSPLFHLSIGNIDTIVRGHKDAICVDLSFYLGMKTYTSLGQGEWEPVIQRTNINVEARQQASSEDVKSTGLPPITELSIRANQEFNLDISHTLLKNSLQVSESISNRHRDCWKPEISVYNTTGTAIYLLMKYGNDVDVKEVPNESTIDVLPPLSPVLKSCTTFQARLSVLQIYLERVEFIAVHDVLDACPVQVQVTVFEEERTHCALSQAKMIQIGQGMSGGGMNKLSLEVEETFIFQLMEPGARDSIVTKMEISLKYLSNRIQSQPLQLLYRGEKDQLKKLFIFEGIKPLIENTTENISQIYGQLNVRGSSGIEAICNTSSLNMDERPDSVLLALSPEGPWDILSFSQGIYNKSFLNVGNRYSVPLVAEPFRKSQSSQLEIKIRSTIKICNLTDIGFGVHREGSVMQERANSIKKYDSRTQDSEITVELYEIQRQVPIRGWGSQYPGHLLPTDPRQWCNLDFSITSAIDPREENDNAFFSLPEDYLWSDNWQVDLSGTRNEAVDPDGWQYAFKFSSFESQWPPDRGSGKKKMKHFVRRRRYVRHCTRAAIIPNTRALQEGTHHEENEDNQICEVLPEDTIAMPLTLSSNSGDFSISLTPFQEGTDEYYPAFSLTSADSTINFRKLQTDSSWLLCSRPKKEGANRCPLHFLLTSEVMKESIGTAQLKVAGEEKISKKNKIKGGQQNETVITISPVASLKNTLPVGINVILYDVKHDKSTQPVEEKIVNSQEKTNLYSYDARKLLLMSVRPVGPWRASSPGDLSPDKKEIEECKSWVRAFPVKHQSGRTVNIMAECSATETACKQFQSYSIVLFVSHIVYNESDLPLQVQMIKAEYDEDSSDRILSQKKTKKILEQVSGEGKEMIVSPLLNSKSSALAMRIGVYDQAWTKLVVIELPKKVQEKMQDSMTGETKVVAEDEQSGMVFFLNLRVDFGQGGMERTKIVTIFSEVVVTNRTGQDIFFTQFGHDNEVRFFQGCNRIPFHWKSDNDINTEARKFVFRVGESRKSPPIDVNKDVRETLQICNKDGSINEFVDFEVSMAEGTNQRVILLESSSEMQAPIRVENRTPNFTFEIIQETSTSEARMAPFTVCPLTARGIARFDPHGSESFDIRIPHLGVHGAFSINNIGETEIIFEGENDNLEICQMISTIRDNVRLIVFMSATDMSFPSFLRKQPDFQYRIIPMGSPSDAIQAASFDPFQRSKGAGISVNTTLEMHFVTVALIDQSTTELLLVSTQQIRVQAHYTSATRASAIKIDADRFRIDDQLPFSNISNILSTSHEPLSLRIVQAATMTGITSFDYINVSFPRDIQIGIHEPIIWKLGDLYNSVYTAENTSRSNKSRSGATVQVDPRIAIGLFRVSPLQIQIGFHVSSGDRPAHQFGFLAGVGLSMVNIENMKLYVQSISEEGISDRQSVFIKSVISRYQKQILGQFHNIVFGLGLFSNAIRGVGGISGAIAALSLDDKYVEARKDNQKQKIENVKDGLKEGGQALAQGFVHGVKGVFTKPLEGAKSDGAKGFITGLGKGIVGIATQPVSGMLDFVQKSAEGARMTVKSRVFGYSAKGRKRLPRAVAYDGILKEYNEKSAQGQAILRLAEEQSILASANTHQERHRYAMSDRYYFHTDQLHNERVLMLTHKRIMLLKKLDDNFQCRIKWQVKWSNVEINKLKKEGTRIWVCRSPKALKKRSVREIEKISCQKGNERQAEELERKIKEAHSYFHGDAPTEDDEEDGFSRLDSDSNDLLQDYVDDDASSITDSTIN